MHAVLSREGKECEAGYRTVCYNERGGEAPGRDEVGLSLLVAYNSGSYNYLTCLT